MCTRHRAWTLPAQKPPHLLPQNPHQKDPQVSKGNDCAHGRGILVRVEWGQGCEVSELLPWEWGVGERGKNMANLPTLALSCSW